MAGPIANVAVHDAVFAAPDNEGRNEIWDENISLSVNRSEAGINVNSKDANGDGQVTLDDARIVLDALASDHHPARLVDGRPLPFNPRLDVNNDHMLSPLDALVIINEVSRQAQTHGRVSAFNLVPV